MTYGEKHRTQTHSSNSAATTGDVYPPPEPSILKEKGPHKVENNDHRSYVSTSPLLHETAPLSRQCSTTSDRDHSPISLNNADSVRSPVSSRMRPPGANGRSGETGLTPGISLGTDQAKPAEHSGVDRVSGSIPLTLNAHHETRMAYTVVHAEFGYNT